MMSFPFQVVIREPADVPVFQSMSKLCLSLLNSDVMAVNG